MTNTSIVDMCQQFLTESNGLPLLKNLPKSYNDFHRVKVRQRKSTTPLAQAFEDAFGNLCINIHQRAVFAQSETSFIPDSTRDAFYILPINNYRFIYSSEVVNSSKSYKQALDLFLEEFEQNKAINILTELLKFTYTNENLTEGIEKGAEIIIYNIPFFFAVRRNAFSSYEDVLKFIKNI